MKTMKKRLLVLFSVWALVMSPLMVGAETPTKIEIEYLDELISADVENASLEDVLDKVTEQTGLSFFINDDVTDTKISTTFKGLELDKGLKKILSRTNYAFVYGPDRSIMKVMILGKIDKEFPDPVPEPESPPGDEMTRQPIGEDDMEQPPSLPPGDAEMVTLEPTDEKMEVLPPSGEPMVIMDADGNYREVPDGGS